MIVVVTGASGAIGKEIAVAFAKKGESLCLVGCKHYDELVSFAQDLGVTYGVRAVTAKADFACVEEVEGAMRYFLSVFGHVDCLVNNAAVSLIKPVLDTTMQEWQQVMDVNVTAAFVATKALLPSLYDRGGSVVNVSSMWGTLGAGCESAYAASKAALEAFGKSVALEYDGAVRVNSVALGYVDTPMNAHLGQAEKESFFAQNPTMRCLTAAQAARRVVRWAYDNRSGCVARLGWKA